MVASVAQWVDTSPAGDPDAVDLVFTRYLDCASRAAGGVDDGVN